MMGGIAGDFPILEFTRYFDFMRHWGDLHEKFVRCASPQFAEIPSRGRREFLANAVAEDDMLISMSSDLGLFREVIRRLNSRPWFIDDLNSLAQETLTEMLFPGNRFDDRERERLNALYPEVFYKLEEVKFDGPKGSPFQIKEIEPDMAELDDLDTALRCVRWSAVSKDVDTEEGFTELMRELIDHGLRLRGVDPIDLESLLDFQDILDKKTMEVTGKMGLPADQTAWIFLAIQDRVMVPETLHFLLMQAMGLRLFRELDHEARHELMDQEYKLQLGPAYAARSMLLLGDYHRDKVQAPEKVLKAIEAQVRDGRQQFALELCLESIKNLPMETSHVDQMEFTSGILFLANDRPRRAAETFQHVLESASRKGDDARKSIVEAYLGTSYALLRRKEDAHRAFADSLVLAKEMKGDAADLLEELLVMADLAHESYEHAVEKGFLQRALSMADGMTNEGKIKQHISMMIEVANALLLSNQ